MKNAFKNQHIVSVSEIVWIGIQNKYICFIFTIKPAQMGLLVTKKPQKTHFIVCFVVGFFTANPALTPQKWPCFR